MQMYIYTHVADKMEFQTLILNESPDVAELIKGCQRMQRTSQYALYEKYKGVLFRICLRYAQNREEAEDLLQEGFIRIFNALPAWKATGSFEGWMKKIVLNVVLDNHRRNHKKRWQEDLTAVENQWTDPQEIQNLHSDDLLNIIQKLPQGFRTVFNLYALEGYNHAEIAEMLNISEGTSKSQYSRAKAQLQSMCHHLLHA